jgi:CBS domain-containing protein
MNITGNVGGILHHKGSGAWSIAPGETVFSAISMMAEKNVGALLVVEGATLLGIVSERDYTRKVILKGRASKGTYVQEIMASPAITVTSQHSVEECLRLMTDHHIRHLPVVESSRIVGLVSIGDLVNWVISAQSATIDHLQGYISGKYPG